MRPRDIATIRRVVVGAVSLLSTVVAAQGATGQEQGTPSKSWDVRVMPGIGSTLFSPLGLGLSAGLALEVSRFLLLGEALAGGGSGLFTLFAGGASGLYRGHGNNVPYALAGMGIVATGNGDDRGHSAVVLSGEFGGAFLRSRERPGQIWLGARVFVPLFDTLASGASWYGGVPSIPILSINLRCWL